MAKKTERPRTARRAAARQDHRAVERLERLVAQLPGGAPEQPLRVSSASVIEVRARAVACAFCEGPLELRAHAAEAAAPGDTRRVDLTCRQCGRPRRLWFRVEPPLAS